MRQRKIQEEVTLSTSQHWQSPCWYRALSLAERAASLQATQHAVSPSAEENEWAVKRLHAWTTQKPFDQEAHFIERLAIDVLTENDLLMLLSESAEALQTRYLDAAAIPGWLVTLQDAFANHTNDEAIVAFRTQKKQEPFILYLQIILPLIKRGLAGLRAGLQALVQQYPFLPFDPEQAIQLWCTHLSPPLLARIGKTCVLEMHVARLQGQLQGETPEKRFWDFVRQFSEEERCLALLEEYPVMARQIVTTIDYWAEYAQEVLTHLCADWEKLIATFTPGHDPGLLVGIKGGTAEVHRQGRRVLILEFSTGFQLVYKPRSLAIDVHFQELLTWLNERGAQPGFRPITILLRDDYSWCEFVRVHDCTSVSEVGRFYERQGGYLALLYALNATDCHAENLIAAGEYPILVDLETLFHPQVGENDPAQPHHLRYISTEHTVLRVALLPQRIWSNNENVGVDLSGLGGPEGQLSPDPRPIWEGIGTDQMRITYQHVTLPTQRNRPKLNGQEVQIEDYQDSLIAGFKNMYCFLQTWRDELVANILPGFAHDKIRLLIRPSMQYNYLLKESFHPDLQRDALERDRAFDRLWRGIELRPELSRIIPAEQLDLTQGNIPFFTTYPDSYTIFTSADEPLAGLINQSGLEQVKQSLQNLDEEDMTKQVWIIKASLATLVMGSEEVTGRSLRMKPPRSSATREQLMAAACAIGERLERLAIHNNYGACWLGVSHVNKSVWSLLPTGTDLYSGTSGIALFLSYLATLTGEARYTELARLALAATRSGVDMLKKYAATIDIGVFEGVGSLLYLLTHLGALWQEPTLLQEATTLVELLAASVAKDESLDIIAGSAGCIMSLLSLYAVSPSERILEVAMQCGERLLATAQPMFCGIAWTTIKNEKPLGGFAHGTAGIALSLLKLAAISNEARYQQAALSALEYDRSLFLPDRQNWADLHARPSQLARAGNNGQPEQEAVAEQPSQACTTAWCHGAGGIGLARLAALEYQDDPFTREEIAVALKTIMSEGLRSNHSLCHGALGNIDVLLTATQTLKERDYQEWLENAKAMVLESIEEEGWVTGIPHGLETPGLMTGIAGIGYELLRLAEPGRVPSVLLIAPPRVETCGR